jgi:hypothetical protein
MLRNVISVIAGYVVMAVATLLCILVLLFVFPEYREAAEAERTPPTLPVVLNVILAAACAVLGGFTTAKIAGPNARSCVLVLAGIVLVLGIVFGLMNRGGVHPDWYLLLLPIAGTLGVLGGGLFATKR